MSAPIQIRRCEAHFGWKVKGRFFGIWGLGLERYGKMKTHLFQSSRYDILTGFKVAIYIFFLERNSRHQHPSFPMPFSQRNTWKTQVAIAACNALGFIFVYFGVFGWAACVLGIVAASMACCVCCQCCNAKMDTEVTVVQQTPVMPIAVGQPVGPAWGLGELTKMLGNCIFFLRFQSVVSQVCTGSKILEKILKTRRKWLLFDKETSGKIISHEVSSRRRQFLQRLWVCGVLKLYWLFSYPKVKKTHQLSMAFPRKRIQSYVFGGILPLHEMGIPTKTFQKEVATGGTKRAEPWGGQR